MGGPFDLGSPVMRLCAVTGDTPEALAALLTAALEVGYTAEELWTIIDRTMIVGEPLIPRLVDVLR